jgi:hypothetical protein
MMVMWRATVRLAVVVAMLRIVSMMIVMTSEFVSTTKTDDMASSEL